MRVPPITTYLFVAAFFVACSGPEQPEQLTAIDVAQHSLDPTDDPVATAGRSRALVGILPADFPADVSLYLPASLIDFESSDGSHWVSLLTQSAVSEVRPALTELLQSNGWTVSQSQQGALTASKGSRHLQISIEDAQPGTEYRIEYSG